MATFLPLIMAYKFKRKKHPRDLGFIINSQHEEKMKKQWQDLRRDYWKTHPNFRSNIQPATY